MENVKFEGTIKFFNTQKGFGFITIDNQGGDIFVHISGLKDDVKEGDRVSFDKTEGRKGMNAINVALI